MPLIAGAHHERLNGTGYPNRLAATDIPLQSKMMSIADIFDALTASDRPYKRAIPIDKALDILNFSVKDGHVDADLVKIFAGGKLWSAPSPRDSIRVRTDAPVRHRNVAQLCRGCLGRTSS